MMVAIAEVTLRLLAVDSLKEKRSIIKSLISRAQNRFNISIAEVAALDSHHEAQIGIACVSNTRAHAEAQLDTVLHFIEGFSEQLELVTIEKEIL